jgi:hypothetical protein
MYVGNRRAFYSSVAAICLKDEELTHLVAVRPRHVCDMRADHSDQKPARLFVDNVRQESVIPTW